MSAPKPPLTRAQSEAAEWLARLGNHEISTDTVREFRAWRDDPANDAAYEEAEALWEASGRHAADPEILRMTEAALAGRRPAKTRGWFGAAPPRALAAVAALALLLVVALVALDRIFPAYTTGPGERRVVTLADGSQVHLNVDSRVQVRLVGSERHIVLSRGEAFFDVAHDPARPFIVQADGARVRALGTKFDVRRLGSAVQVTLLQGKVQVAPPSGAALTLAPDQQVTIASSGSTRRVETDAARATSWTAGRLVFHETPLAEAVAEVNRYGRRKIALDDPALAARRLDGVFDLGDTDGFVAGVTTLFDLKASQASDGTIRLRAAAAGPAPAGAGSQAAARTGA